MDTGSPRWGLWKTRIKSGENALLTFADVIRYALIEHSYRSMIQGGIANGSRNDQDTACSACRREAFTEQQAGSGVDRISGRGRDQGNQEERRICRAGFRPTGEIEPQGAHRSQPADRRSYQNSRQDRREVPRGQGRERHHRTCKEVVATL